MLYWIETLTTGALPHRRPAGLPWQRNRYGTGSGRAEGAGGGGNPQGGNRGGVFPKSGGKRLLGPPGVLRAGGLDIPEQSLAGNESNRYLYRLQAVIYSN